MKDWRLQTWAQIISCLLGPCSHFPFAAEEETDAVLTKTGHLRRKKAGLHLSNEGHKIFLSVKIFPCHAVHALLQHFHSRPQCGKAAGLSVTVTELMSPQTCKIYSHPACSGHQAAPVATAPSLSVQMCCHSTQLVSVVHIHLDVTDTPCNRLFPK